MASKSAWQESEGLFDVTVGAAQLWGSMRSVRPGPEQEIAAVRRRSASISLSLTSLVSVRFGVDGMRLDFGGLRRAMRWVLR